jgi:hypothetical protein
MLLLETAAGYNLRIDPVVLQTALDADKVSLTEGAAELRKMVDKLIASKAVRLPPQQSAIQRLAIQLVQDARLASIKIDAEPPADDVVTALLTYKREQYLAWLDKQTPEQLLAANDNVVYLLTGQRQKPDQAVNAAARRALVRKAERDGTDLSKKLLLWTQTLQAVKKNISSKQN